MVVLIAWLVSAALIVYATWRIWGDWPAGLALAIVAFVILRDEVNGHTHVP